MISIGGAVGLAASPIVLMGSLARAASKINIPISEVRSHPEIMMQGFKAVFAFMVFACISSLVFSVLAADKE